MKTKMSPNRGEHEGDKIFRARRSLQTAAVRLFKLGWDKADIMAQVSDDVTDAEDIAAEGEAYDPVNDDWT